MIRITVTDEPQRTMITVDGELTGEGVEAAEASCNQAGANRKPVWLFLRGVSVIADAGRALLRRLAANGVRLTASGVYTLYVVQSVQPNLNETSESLSRGVSTPDKGRPRPSRNPRFACGRSGARKKLAGSGKGGAQ